MKPVLVRQSSISGGSDETDGPLRPGLLVAGKYRLDEQLGSGSMGSVWRARHLTLGHGVAIKFLHASVENSSEGRVRFEREGKLAARLGEASNHICRVTDFGVLRSGAPYVVMELLQGEVLLARLKREQVLDLPLTAAIVAQLCRALSVAHQAGVIHRDLKPANVFLCPGEGGQGVFVKLLDFGVALAPVEDPDTEGTRPGFVVGTPGYISPEQITGEALDARSDLWSVAVLVYRMAVGRAPFGTGSMTELGVRILTHQPDPPSRVRPELPATFDAWMKKALAKSRNERFASATELADALLAACSAPAPRRRFWPHIDGGARSARWWATLAAATVVCSLGALAAWTRDRPEARPAPASPARTSSAPRSAPASSAVQTSPTRAPPPSPAPAPSAEQVAPTTELPPSPAPASSAEQASPTTTPPQRVVPASSAAQASPTSTLPEAQNAPPAPGSAQDDPARSIDANEPRSGPAPSAPAKPPKRARTKRAAEPPPEPLEQRAADLWNKADEL
jgi:serine/threonine protein kinase